MNFDKRNPINFIKTLNEMIPLSQPYLEGNEWKYVKDCLDTGWISSAGSYVTQFERMVADYVGAKFGIACMNGTVGLHLSLLATGVDSESHVIVPNLTFIATLNAVKYLGAKPILIDVDTHNWQLDLNLLEQFLSENTYIKDNYCYHKTTHLPIKAIVPVHVFGNMCDISKIIAISKNYNIQIIEDSTESLGTITKGKHSGTFGEIGVFSFNGNKIISTGGGGVIVTNNELLAKQIKHLTTQAKSDPEEYIHDAIGYNYRLVNVLAAIGVAQLEQFPKILKKKQNIDKYYRKNLNGIGDVIFQEVSKDVTTNCWLFTFKTQKMRALISFLNNNSIMCRPIWKPMNELEMFQKDIYITSKNVSKEIYNSCISIPSSAGLTKKEMNKVVSKIKEFYEKY